MVSSNNLNAMSVSIIANDMSKTIFKSTYEDNISEYCKQVLDYEVESLELSRTRRDIGIYPSDLHSYEIISMAKDPAKFEMIIEGRSFPVEVNTFLVGQLEMAIKLAKPSSIVFMSCNFFALPLDYLESLNIENVYIPNDENVYRAENIYLNRECNLNVLNPADLQNGIFPSNVDMFVANATHISMGINPNIIQEMYDHLPVNGVLYIINSNDFMAYYDNVVDISIASVEGHPMYDVNTAIAALDNALVYHIPTGAGFTVIIKG
jgi:hypothetical protein